jgi:hypothetical protein
MNTIGDFSSRKKVGLALFAGGVMVALACHLAGSWELLKYKGAWISVHSEELEYTIPCYDILPAGSEAGRIVIYGGFVTSAQLYFPLALPLVRSGYAVRIATNSGSPNSPVPMSYESHTIETTAAARDFLGTPSDIKGFLIGHSEGTRYAMEAGRELAQVYGVVVLSTVSAAVDARRPPNVLMLVAEDDSDAIKRQAHVALINGTGLRNPQFGALYGDAEKGTARMAEIVPDTNHVNIFIKEATQRRTLRWINRLTGATESRVGSRFRSPLLVLAVLFGTSLAIVGLGLVFFEDVANFVVPALHPLSFFCLVAAAWVAAAVVASTLDVAGEIPMLGYGRVLACFAIATLPLLMCAFARPRWGAGLPSGRWTARVLLVAVTGTLLLFDMWLVNVMPQGRRLFWFGLAILVTGAYFAGDEFLRRAIQRARGWQTGLVLGLAEALVAALAVAGAAFFLGPPVGRLLVSGAVTLFVLMAVCEVLAAYLFAATADWLLSWWIRVSIFNGFLAGIVPYVTETDFRMMIP